MAFVVLGNQQWPVLRRYLERVVAAVDARKLYSDRYSVQIGVLLRLIQTDRSRPPPPLFFRDRIPVSLWEK